MPHDRPDQPDERSAAHAAGLRRVAVASVAALAVVLPLAVAGAGRHPEQHREASHSTSHRPDAGPGSGAQ